MAQNNYQLEIFNLDGVDPAATRGSNIEISSNLDAKSIFTVTTLDKGIIIASNEDIKRLINQADQKRKNQVESRIHFVQLAYQVDHMLKDKLSQEDEKSVKYKYLELHP